MKIKEIIKKHLAEMPELIRAHNNNITHAVRALCIREKYEFSDTLRRNFSKKLTKEGLIKSQKGFVPIEHSDEYQEAVKREVKESKYYLVTWAQAETPIHKQFWENMKAFASHIGAEIIVMPARYKSPTSLEASKNIERKERNKSMWDSELRSYLYANRIKLNNRLSVLTDVKVQPTAKLPISGLNGFTGESSSILPHPKVQLKSVPRLPSNPHKLILTTGAVTLPDYTDTKIGKESEWTHEFGFVLAEIVSDNKYFVHNVLADDSGTFYFLDYKVQNCKVFKEIAEAYPAMTFGDIHYGETDPEAYKTSVKIANRLGVMDLFLHDIANFHSISHHDLKSPMKMLRKEVEGLDNLETELDLIYNSLSELERSIHSQLHIVESNHPLWLNQWLDNNDWRKSNNKKLYLHLANIVASGETGKKGLMNYLIEQEFPNIKTYTEDDSLQVSGYEMLIHGHRGASGSKGGINQFKGLSTKGVSGHSHVPERVNGWLVAGTLTILDPEYVRGLTSWMHSNVVIAPNGKATHIHIINGLYSTL